jgi:ring-1,2-phenylacetyl-CoA epoxidase subunit PaaC
VTPRQVLALRLADDCLVLSQRLSEWAARAPTLEEDVALLNVALDQLGTARSLYGGLVAAGVGADEDALAMRRDEPDWVNALLVELDGGDFGKTMARQLLVSAWQVPLWAFLADHPDPLLSGVAGKAVKEARYHLDHARTWVVRLGDGTAESHARVQAGLEEVWPYAAELFETDEVTAAVGLPDLRAQWAQTVGEVLVEATLEVPTDSWRPTGGRRGAHTEAFGYLLAELQHLHRSHPGAVW